MSRGCVKLELRLWLCYYLDVVCVLLSSGVNRNEELNFAIRRGLWKRSCIAYLDHLSGVDNGLLASSEKQDLTSTSLRVL